MTSTERGFTLIELIVAVAIMGIIVIGVSAATSQLFNAGARSTARMLAVKEVENANHWLTRDVLMAQSVNPGNPSGFPLTLAWVEWNNTSHQVTYSVQNGQLQRAHSLNGGQPTSTVVVQHIDADPQMTKCTMSNEGVVTLTITATTVGFRSASETRSFEIVPRSGP